MTRYKFRLRLVRLIFATAYRLPLEHEIKTMLLGIKQALDNKIKGE